MTRPGDRIFERRKELNLTQLQIAKGCGVTKAAVSNWETHKDDPKGPNLVKLAAFLGVYEQWITTGRGPKMRPRGTLEMPEDGLFIPLIDYVAAGRWSAISDPYGRGAGMKRLLTGRPVSKSAFALTVRGNSMEPDFLDGDDIIVDPSLTPRPGDYVVAKREAEEEATFKKFRSRGENEKGKPIIELLPLNSDYPPLYIDEKRPGRVVGVVVEHRRYLR